MKSMGMPMTQTEITDFMNQADTDRSGSVSLDEFLKCMTGPATSESDIASQFKVFDEDGNGTITKEELMNVLCKLGSPLSNSEAEDLI
jgi:calmodulin